VAGSKNWVAVTPGGRACSAKLGVKRDAIDEVLGGAEGRPEV
jgi:hypothetical protein